MFPAEKVDEEGSMERKSFLKVIVSPAALATALLGFYCLAFYFGRDLFRALHLPGFQSAVGVSKYWFHPGWTTDDALQQSYPFHKVLYPELFTGDLITEMMERYLAPIHYWLTWGITILTKDPIMSGHWGMLIQLGLSMLFLFLAVRRYAGWVPACFAATWLLHTRHVVQRLTGGLPRGWSLPLFCCYFFLIATERWRWILLLLAAGTLLHPPGTFLIALCHGIYLLLRVTHPATRATFKAPFKEFLIAAPFIAVLALSVTRMPPEIGRMADAVTASQMPEFQAPAGRFPFLPLRPAWEEIRMYGFQSFTSRFYSPGKELKAAYPVIVIGLSLGVLAAAWALRRRVVVIPAEILSFFVASLLVYLASRELLFHLYVPNRHLQIPFAVFFILFFSVAVWRLAQSFRVERGNSDLSWRASWPGVAGLIALGALIYIGSGHGLQGTANFNHTPGKRSALFEFAREKTPLDSIFAGEPTLIDPIQLYGKRQGFVTTETSHPFYDVYYREMARRLEISWRAHFAQSAEELVDLLAPEGIDYFVFDRRHFTPAGIAAIKYFEPLRELVRSLAKREPSTLLYQQLLAKRLTDGGGAPEDGVVPFKDRVAVVVDVARLRETLTTATEPPAQGQKGEGLR